MPQLGPQGQAHRVQHCASLVQAYRLLALCELHHESLGDAGELGQRHLCQAKVFWAGTHVDGEVAAPGGVLGHRVLPDQCRVIAQFATCCALWEAQNSRKLSDRSVLTTKSGFSRPQKPKSERSCGSKLGL